MGTIALPSLGLERAHGGSIGKPLGVAPSYFYGHHPFFRWENQGSERINDVVTQFVFLSFSRSHLDTAGGQCFINVHISKSPGVRDRNSISRALPTLTQPDAGCREPGTCILEAHWVLLCPKIKNRWCSTFQTHQPSFWAPAQVSHSVKWE